MTKLCHISFPYTLFISVLLKKTSQLLIYLKIENALGGPSEVFESDVTLTFVAEFLTTFGDPEEKSNTLSSSSSSILFSIGFDNGLLYSGYEVFERR